MANRLRGETTLALGGETFTLRPTFAAIMEIEDRLGGIVPLATRAAAGDFGLKEVTIILWATLNGASPRGLSLDEVGERVLHAGLAAVTPVVRDLLTTVLTGGQPEEGGGPAPGKAAAPPVRG